MKPLHIQFSKVLLATIVSLGGLATISTVGNINRAVADDQMTEDSSISQEMSVEDSIVKQLSDNESFSVLVQAVEAAGLVETLSNAGDYTVFAPTDEAFAALPAGTLEALLKPENLDVLTQILKYHVVLGAANSTEISTGQFKTAAGTPVAIDVNNGTVKVGNAQVIAVDLQASNGVIHTVNQVILPPEISAAELEALSAIR
ncbi:MAG: fasciclin domain-containing protein [Microcoleaceae cyanobacterium]